MNEVKPATDPLMGMDAREWAREFLLIWSGRWSEVDEGLMIGWFANAIMRGFDEGRRRTDAEKDAEIARLKAAHERDMCADGHERIRYTPAEDFGTCPLCVLRADNSTNSRLLALKDGEINSLKAEVERLTPKCPVCLGHRTTTPAGNIPCQSCGGTGRAR